MINLSIIIPIYNEAEAVKDTIERIQKLPLKEHKIEIIAVNDGSTDNTLTILKSVNGIKIIDVPYNIGYSASIKRGMSQAQGDWIVITDADGTYPVEEIPTLMHDIPSYDMVVGSRTGKNVNIPFFRKPAKWIIGKLANFMAGKK